MPFTSLTVLFIIVLGGLLIYFLEERNIYRTWFTPANQRFKEFLSGLLFMAVLCLLSQFALSMLNGVSWSFAEDLSSIKISHSLIYDLNSVLFEELLFRGVLLYLLITYLTEQKGTLVSASAFGIYHWFTFGVFGNIPGMMLVFITTGYMGFVFAKSYVKTDSIILPVGLHLGWNWINNTIFSNGPNGNILLVTSQNVEINGYLAIVSFLWYLLVPSVTLLFLKSDLFERTNSPKGLYNSKN